MCIEASSWHWVSFSFIIHLIFELGSPTKPAVCTKLGELLGSCLCLSSTQIIGTCHWIQVFKIWALGISTDVFMTERREFYQRRSLPSLWPYLLKTSSPLTALHWEIQFLGHRSIYTPKSSSYAGYSGQRILRMPYHNKQSHPHDFNNKYTKAKTNFSLFAKEENQKLQTWKQGR